MTISKDDVLDVISTERRRLAVQYLDQHADPVELSDMAEWISAHQHDCDITELDATQRKRAYIPLYQNHLPKMEELGVVNLEIQKSGPITRGPAFEDVRDVLNAIDETMAPGETQSGGLRAFFGGAVNV